MRNDSIVRSLAEEAKLRRTAREELEQRVLELRAAGLTHREIAERLGLAVQRTQRMLARRRRCL